MTDVLVLIEKLEDTVENARLGRLGTSLRVDREETYAILEQMRATIPQEMKNARWITKERQEMLAEARRESERILKDAREERARLIGTDEIARLAERRAEQVVASALSREREIRLGAEDYADDIMESLQMNLDRFRGAVQRGRNRLQRSEEPAVA
jgi:hypothetical protein